MTYEAEREVAQEAAVAAGALALELYGRRPAARLKHDGTWVTEADEAVEAELRRRIGAAFPEHNVLGEEDGLQAASGGPARAGVPTWVVDPIDGTASYVAGIPIWAVLVGLRIDGTSVVGVAHAPALGETYEASAGGGARMNGEAIRAEPVDALEDATVLYGSAAAFLDTGLDAFLSTLLARSRRDRGLGEFWGHLLVARGAAHVMVEAERLKLWDVVALEPIIAEAGAVLSRHSGEPWTEGEPSMTCCSRALQAEVVAAFSGRYGPALGSRRRHGR